MTETFANTKLGFLLCTLGHWPLGVATSSTVPHRTDPPTLSRCVTRLTKPCENTAAYLVQARQSCTQKVSLQLSGSAILRFHCALQYSRHRWRYTAGHGISLKKATLFEKRACGQTADCSAPTRHISHRCRYGTPWHGQNMQIRLFMKLVKGMWLV